MFGTSLVEQRSEREIVFSRVLDAPRELVWAVWTTPEHLNAWFGPTGFTLTTHEFSFVPGGEWKFIMHGPDGTDYPNRVVFREITPPSRLEYENGWDLPGAPLDFIMVTTLQDIGRKTKLSMHMTFADAAAFRTASERYGVRDGGLQTLNRIAAYLNDTG